MFRIPGMYKTCMTYLLNVSSSFNDPTNDPKDDTDDIASSTKSRV